MSSYPNHRAHHVPVDHGPVDRQSVRGFTVIELMITLSVFVILVTLGLPSFISVLNSGKINSQANEFVATLQLARMEAIRRNARVVVCPSTDGTSCAAATATWTGWVAFVDDGGYSHSWASGVPGNANNGTVDANEPVLRSGTMPAAVGVTTSSNISGTTGGAIIFRPDGLARDNAGVLLNGRIGVCIATTHPAENARNVIIQTGGRIAVEHVTNVSCAAPNNTNT